MTTTARVALVLGGLGLLTAACASPTPPAAPSSGAEQPSPSGLERGWAALEAARYAEAESLFRDALGDGMDRDARLGLARVLLETGRFAEAEAMARNVTGEGRELVLGAQALALQGRLDEALTRLGKLGATAPLRIRLEGKVLTGETLLELGRRDEAEAPLLEVIAAYNDGSWERAPGSERGEILALVGRAAHLLRSPEDANEAFNQAEELGAVSVRTLLFRGALFLEKFDFAHAEEVATEALERAPTHPDALVLLAEIRLGQALAFDEATRLAQEALSQNPAHTRARFVLAGVALRDFDLDEAQRQVDAGLTHNPRQLELLSMKGAAIFLSEDTSGFESLAAEVESLSPGYARFYDVVAEYAEWEHRYEDMEKLLRRAVRLDRGDGRIRANLGLTLVRSGSDAQGVVELRTAFELDPYNVRALNTLDLYEKIIPRDYDELRQGPFVFRFPKADRALLERYVPQLLDEAHRALVERYGFTPRAPLGIEIYATKSEFAVRTTGLPQAGIAGVCFGRKLATVSPRGAPGNLGMTLWHELSHVFHIGLSESRVPRWVTEGLAEWETASLDRGWARELDVEVYRALRAGKLPPLETFGQAFTHAESMNDIAVAYHASKRWADFVVASYGSSRATRLLGELGKKRLPREVVPEVLGAPFGELDQKFQRFLSEQYAGYEEQFVSELPSKPLPELERAAMEKDASRSARRDRALGLFREGRLSDASRRLNELLAEEFEPLVAFFLARTWMAQGDRADATRLVERVLASGTDGFELRLLLARLHATEAKWKDTAKHAARATELDPTQVEAWSLLAAAAHELGERDKEIGALASWTRLSEHDSEVHQRYLELLLASERLTEAAQAAELALWAGLGDPATHRLTAFAFARGGQKKRAAFEWETALLVASPEQKAKLQAERPSFDEALRR